MENSEFILKAFREYNNTNNYRQSFIRETVFLELWNSDDDKDADTLFFEMLRKGKNVKLGSIYNALSWLSEKGFLQKNYSDRKAMYNVHKHYSIELLKCDQSCIVNP